MSKIEIKDENNIDGVEYIQVFKPFNSEIVVVSILILSILILSGFVFWRFHECISKIDASELVVNQGTNTELTIDYTQDYNSIDISFLSNTNKIERNKKVLIWFLCLYFTLSIIAIIVLFCIAITSDSGIRFAKLNALYNLKLMTDGELQKNLFNYETTQESIVEKIKTNIYVSDGKKPDISKMDVNLNAPIITTTKQKDSYSEFLKNYMNAIVEI